LGQSAPAAATPSDSDPLDDFSDDPPKPKKLAKTSASKGHSASAAATPSDADSPDDFSDDPPKPTPNRHQKQQHHQSADADADVAETSSGGSSSGGSSTGSSAPSGLQGGWQALLKDKKNHNQKKHVFKDQASGIMDLVQTPSAYTAWQPPSAGDAGVVASAKNELLAAEKAFDVAGSDGASFLQLASASSSARLQERPGIAGPPHVSPQARHGNPLELLTKIRQGSVSHDNQAKALAIASLVLEKYARALDSDALLRISRSHLTADRLQDLWQKLRRAKVDGQMSPKERQATKWCADFARESETLSLQDSEHRKRISASQGAAGAEKRALLLEVSVRKRMVDAVVRSETALEQLNAICSKEAADVDTRLQQLFVQARQASAEGATAEEDGEGPTIGAGELIGLAEGLEQAGAAELQDAVTGTLGRRQTSLQAAREGLEKAQARLQALERSSGQQETSNIPAGGGSGSPGGGGSLRDRYGQMCKWTLETIQARRRKQEGERDAVKATVTVLAAR